MKFEIIAGDFPKQTKYSCPSGTPTLSFPDYSRNYLGLVLNKRFPLKGKIEKVELVTEDNKRTLLRSTAWGLTGLAVGSLIAAPVAVVAGLAGLMRNQKEVCFACYLKGGQKFLAVANITIYQELSALSFDETIVTDVIPPDGEPRDEIDCPYCAERILARAKVCKHCGRSISREGPEATAAPNLNVTDVTDLKEVAAQENQMAGKHSSRDGEHGNVHDTTQSIQANARHKDAASPQKRPSLSEGLITLSRCLIGGFFLLFATTGVVTTIAGGFRDSDILPFILLPFFISLLVLPPIRYFNDFSIIQRLSTRARFLAGLGILCITILAAILIPASPTEPENKAGVAQAAKPVASTLTSINLVPFSVTGRDMVNVSLLVPRGTSEKQLSDLIIGINCAYKMGNVAELGIPPSTDSGGLQVYVFDDPRAASAEKLKQVDNLREDSKDFERITARFFTPVKAYFVGNRNHIEEKGSLGYRDDYDKSAATYRPIELPTATQCPTVVASEQNRKQMRGRKLKVPGSN